MYLIYLARQTIKMRSRSSLLLALSAILLVSVFSLEVHVGRAWESSQGSQQKAVVFVVSGMASASEGFMLPILITDAGKYTTPVAGDSDAALVSRFSDEHYRKGQRYRLLFGGAEVGSVTIKKSDQDEQCTRTGADVNIQSDVKLNRNVMALATDSKTLGRAAVDRSRRAPSESERAQALELARSLYQQKSVPASLLTNLQTMNLTATDLNHDGKAELVGSFVVSKRTNPQARYALFLLAEPEGESYRIAISHFEKFTGKDIMSGASMDAVNEGTYVERLVDQLDLDGDRLDELITTKTGLEGDSYQIYQKQSGQWGKIYEFSNYRCAF